MQTGIPFTKKPVALQFDYKVKMSDRENRIRATGFSKITDVPGKDYPAAILLLQKRWEDANGNVYAKRIGTMVTYYYHSTDWKIMRPMKLCTVTSRIVRNISRT